MADPGLIEEFDVEEEAVRMNEYYSALKAQNIDRSDLLPPADPLTNKAVDITKIIAGDEMQSLGIDVDSRGFSWKMDTMKDFWSQHPIRAGVAMATSVLPGLAVLTKEFRGAKTAGISADVIKAANLLDDSIDYEKLAAKEQELLKSQVYNLTKTQDLNSRIETMGDAAPMKDRVQYKLNQWFGNKYMEDTDPVNGFSARAEWVKGTNHLLREGGDINYFLKEAPPEDIGPSLARFFTDPTEIKNIPVKYQAYAQRMADDLRSTQAVMRKEGFLSDAEASNVGDIWFSTLEKNTTLDSARTTTLIDTTGDQARILQVPKTTSPNLLTRRSTKEEVVNKIVKEQAMTALSQGDNATALKLLNNSAFEDASNLIKAGQKDEAINLLNQSSNIDFSPKSLTINSVFQQKMLLENYRYLREIALNPEITKTADQIAAMHPRSKKNWIHLDAELDGADRLRRMVSAAKGGEEIQSLGYVPKSLFKEMKALAGSESDDGGFVKGVTDLVSAITAVHKTVKTGFNVPTHFQNIGGNWALLVNAGVNPFSKEFIQLQKASAKAIWEVQQSKRATGKLETAFKSEMKLKSKIEGAKDISIADELNSPELQDIVELSSISSAEGIGVLERIANSADDDLTGTVVKMMNKTISNAKIGKINPLEMTADIYGAEDGMAKMSYYLHLRQKGLSRKAASMEVGRRLPMYHTIGGAQKSMRNAWLPWISYPSEIARIMKNNLSDYPLRTAAMMQIPELLQSGSYATAGLMGRGMNATTIQENKEQLPTWAYKPTTVMTPFTDKNGDYRAAVLDFLPHSAVLPESLSSDSPMLRNLPFGAGEPLPILSGMYMAMTGKDPWGNEIPTKDLKQKIATVGLSFMGFISPPIVQKYLFNPTDPNLGYKFMTDMGQNLNPYTEKSGDPLYDFFTNSFGPVKMYPASPEQKLANESMTTRDIQAYRGKVAKEFSALIKSGDIKSAGDKLKEVMETFTAEFDDPGMSQRKMSEWLKTHTKDLKRHPQLKGLSKEELRLKIDQLTDIAASNRSRALEGLIETHRNELSRRGRNSAGGSQNPFAPRKF